MTILKRPGLWILISIIAVTGYFVYRKNFSPVEVNGIVVKRQDIETTVTGTSTGVIKSEVEANITAQRIGNITKLFFDEGDMVKAGDLVAALEASEVSAYLKKTESDLKQSEVNLLNLKAEYQRKEALYRESLITKQQFDDVQFRLDIAEAAVKSAKATRDTFQLQYEYSFIRTPVKGVITERPVDVGDTVLTGQKIASVVDPDMLYVSVPVDEADVGSVAIGQSVRITLDAYPGQSFHGKVLRISPVVTGSKMETRTFEVRTTKPEADITLKPGMSADIEIVTGVAKNVLAVPSQAMSEERGEQFVYVSEAGLLRKRKIRIGLYNWNLSEALEGLKEGEIIILAPDVPGFREGMRVKVVHSSK